MFGRWITILAMSFLAGCTLPGPAGERWRPAESSLSGVSSVSPAMESAAPEQDAVRPASHVGGIPSSQPLSLAQSVPAVALELKLESTVSDANDPEALSLADAHGIALQHNPTIRQANAEICKAQGVRTQVGLRPNPSMGYQAMQVADLGTDQHTFFLEREFVTGKKLLCNQSVASKSVQIQRSQLEAQRQRVLTDVSLTYMEALASQQRIKLIAEFIEVAEAGLKIAELRIAALEGTQVEVLQAEIQKNEVELQLSQAEVRFNALMRELSALCGIGLANRRLEGTLPEEVADLVWADVAESIIASSPEYHVALSDVELARASLQRNRIQNVPNLTMHLATGYDNGTDNGLLNFEVSSPLMINNKNQGNITTSRADLAAKQAELKRVRDSIYSRVADVSKHYDASSAAVRRYSQVILPKSKESLELAEQAYQIGESSFLVVLTARRTFFEANLRYLDAQMTLAQSKAKLDGLVLTGGLDRAFKPSLDSGLRDRTFSQQ